MKRAGFIIILSVNDMSYQARSPVLFLLFNRPHTTQRVFDAIKHVKPPRLYIAADGPRSDREGEAESCTAARAVADHVNWPCDVKLLFREVNLGCKEAVASAIDWFFDQEEEGIILEDDCLPADDFFRFCDLMLERYRHDTRIRHIGGSNLQYGKKWGDGSYYYSHLTHAWGWASWRRVWNDYDKELTAYTVHHIRKVLSRIFAEPIMIDAWLKIFKLLKAGMINTWDYQLTLINFAHNGLSVIPNVNLISNIGFGSGATHTLDQGNRNDALPLSTLDDIIHPASIVPQKQADYNTLAYDFEVERIKKKQQRIDRRMRRGFKKIVYYFAKWS